MSPELEILDQLLGADLPLAAIHILNPDTETFTRAILGLLTSGDVHLFTINQSSVPTWRWRELFVDGLVMGELESFKLRITEQGMKRIA